MQVFWWWWIAAAIVVAFELATGTFYLLMVAIGLAAGGLTAWAGHGFSIQLLVASALAIAGCWVVQRMRAGMPAQAAPQRNPDVQIDLGQSVMVNEWQANGTAVVQYRGAQWSAQLDEGQTASLGLHAIVAMNGSALVLKRID
jgi:membrane protein implicated in regulation of membrane protease activity